MANIGGKVFKKWKPQLNKYLFSSGRCCPELPLLMIDAGRLGYCGQCHVQECHSHKKAN